MKKTSKIIAIVGPTATGKSKLAIELAKRLNAEIISADSRLIYKKYNIATAKPTEEEKQNIKHHLIDIIEPNVEFSASDFNDTAKKIISDLNANNKNIIITGGTGFYLRILLEGLQITEVKPNYELREELEKLAKEEGNLAVYKILQEIDVKASEKIHPNNLDKVIRAIEITKSINSPFSSTEKEKSPEYDVVWIGLNAKDRQFLYNRINSRVDEMINKGLEEEAKTLYEKYKETKSYQNTIGYQEFIPYFEGQTNLPEVIEQIKQNSRHYAKRQLTWFRANPDINWFYIDDKNFDELLKEVYAFLTSSFSF